MIELSTDKILQKSHRKGKGTYIDFYSIFHNSESFQLLHTLCPLNLILMYSCMSTILSSFLFLLYPEFNHYAICICISCVTVPKFLMKQKQYKQMQPCSTNVLHLDNTHSKRSLIISYTQRK